MSMIYSYWQHVVSWRLLACRKVQKALLPTRIYETCKAMKCQPVDNCQIMLHCYIWQTPKKKAHVRCTDHPSTRQTLFLCPCIRLFYFDRLRLGRWWKCRRTSQLRRNGRTKSSGRWTRTWTANSLLKNLLRFIFYFPISTHLGFLPGRQEWSLNCATAPVRPRPSFLKDVEQDQASSNYTKPGSRISPPYLKIHILLLLNKWHVLDKEIIMSL